MGISLVQTKGINLKNPSNFNDQTETNERSLYFHLEQFLGSSLFTLAQTSDSIYELLLGITIPETLWNALEKITLNTERSEDELRFLSIIVHHEVLVHTILDLPQTPNWEQTAAQKAHALTPAEIKHRFWKGIAKHDIAINDGIASLSAIGVTEEDIRNLFE